MLGARERQRLEDMLENAKLAISFTEKSTFEQFSGDLQQVYATLHALQIVGEAAREIPDAVRAILPGVPWREIVGMRNVIVHGYLGIDLDIVWAAARTDLPSLIELLQSFLREQRETNV